MNKVTGFRKRFDHIFSKKNLITKKIKSLIAHKVYYKSRLRIKTIEQIKDLY